jgi:hypothetical protein
MSPQRELSRILPSVASFLFFLSPVDLYCVSSEITIMDFALNGLSFSSLVDTVSSQRELSRVLPSVVLILL